MSKLKFYRGLEALYNATTHADGVYFATDTHKIFMNGSKYGGDDANFVADVAPKEGDASKIVITFKDNSTKEVPVGKVSYTSKIEDKNLVTPSAVGGIAKDTKVSDLEGKSYDEMFDDLLFPTVNPTFSAPSASLSLASGTTVREVGSVAPNAQGFNKAFNKGAITLNGVKQNNRAGDSINDFIYFGDSEANTTLPELIVLGDANKYTYKVEFGEGPQPKNNKGGNYSSPLAAGSVKSAVLVINGTYPWFASTASNTALAKQGLIKWNATAGAMTTPQFTLKGFGAGVGKQTFKLPRKLQSLTQLNTLSGKFESVSTSQWTETQVSESINGNDVTYYVYEYAGDDRDDVTLIAKF